MAYTSKDWPKLIFKQVKDKIGEEVANQIMDKIAEKFGFDWDSTSSVFTFFSKTVTGTNILAWVAAGVIGGLKSLFITASMPAIQSNNAIEKTGHVWFEEHPKNPYNPNEKPDQYVDYLVYSWVISYLTTGCKYAEPIFEF